MTFLYPIWLYVGAFGCAALALLMMWSGRKRKRALRRFVGTRHVEAFVSSLSASRRRLKQTLLILGTACAFVALARPLWGYHFEEARREGVDLMFAVDTSKSMLAQDLRPNRLERAKLAVEELGRRIEGGRFGLVAFAGDAFLQTPLTLDRDMFSLSLSALDTSIIPIGGTDVATAIRAAEHAFSTEPNRRKVLVLMTDGEDLEGNAITAAEQAAKDGMTIYTVGLGTAQGELIPVTDAKGRADLLRDPAGEPVRSRLDEAALQKIAQVTGGAYQPLGQSGQGLEVLYRDHLARLAKESVTSRMNRIYHEQFQWPLAAAILLLLIEPVMGERRKRKASRPVRSQTALAVAAALILMLGMREAKAATSDTAAPVITYNEGTVQYREGGFEGAAEAFGHALDTADVSLQQQAYYNLGNARYRIGETTLASNPAQTKASWIAAIEAFDGALALAPNDQDAWFNRDFVARKLAELEKKQDEQQKQDDQKQDDQKQGQQKQGQQKNQDPQQGQGEPKSQDQQPSQDPQQGQGEQQSEDQQQGQAGDPQGEQGKAEGKDKQGTESDPRDQEQGQEQPQDAQQDQQQSGEPQQDPQAGQPQGGQTGNATQAQASTDVGEPAAPGGLTRAESAQLLDALEGELQRLPFKYGARGEAEASDDRARKDW